MSIHGHRVLEMMAGKSYTEDGLLKEIHANFGEEALFHTCSAENMDATQLIGFLKHKGKFLPAQGEQFTVDKSSVCDHE